MCLMCDGAIDRCWICQKAQYAAYYVDDETWCEHMIEKHGTDSPGHYAHFAWGDHAGEDCECRKWWPGKPEPKYGDGE